MDTPKGAETVAAGDYETTLNVLESYFIAHSGPCTCYCHLLAGDLLYEYGDGTEATLREAARHYRRYVEQVKPCFVQPRGLCPQLQAQAECRQLIRYGLPITKEDWTRAQSRLSEMEAQGISSSGCMIATAVYWSSEAPQVVTLRWFRDNHLLRAPAGRALVGVYYRCSPLLFWLLKRSWVLRKLVRAVLLAPVVAVLSRLQRSGDRPSGPTSGPFRSRGPRWESRR